MSSSSKSLASRIGVALIILAAIVFYAYRLLIPLYLNTGASDFANAYYPPAQLLVNGGDPYSIKGYLQPPALLLVFVPFVAIPPESARALWLLVELLMLTAGIIAALRLFDVRPTDITLYSVLLVYLSPNIAWGVMIGQSVVLVFLLQMLGMWFLREGRSFLGGLFLGSMVLKPHMLAVALPILLSAPRKAWVGAAVGIGVLLVGPELVRIQLLGPFFRNMLNQASVERYNKLNPADMFVNLFGAPTWLRALGWMVLAFMAILYTWALWRIWRERSSNIKRWELTPAVQQGMLLAFLWLPYTLAYDMILVVGSYVWLFKVRGYRLDRPLTWNLGLLWMLPILTLVIHLAGLPTTLNPLLIIGLLLLLLKPNPQPTPDLALARRAIST